MNYDNFWKHVNKKDGCWEWIGSKDKRGYGSFGLNGKTTSAHRVSWLIHFGEIPNRMFVCHHCDNPSCVNPSHLFLGTQKDNIQDMIKKKRYHKQTCWKNAIGEKHPSSKLTNEQVRIIRNLYTQGNLSTYSLGTLYKVDAMTIWYIIRNKTYKDV